MEKGTRVRITKGKGEGKTGAIFWIGENKYGPGKRMGIRGDDGETYWAPEGNLEAHDGPPPAQPEAEHTYGKGDRVQYEADGATMFGTVFWTGESRTGGQRLGLKAEADGETVWRDARYVEPAQGEAPSPRASAPQGSAVYGEGEVSEMPADYAAPLSEDELPPFAGFDDAEIDQLAAVSEDASEQP